MPSDDRLVELRMMRDGVCPECKTKKHVEKSQSGEKNKKDRQVTFACDNCDGEWSYDSIAEQLHSLGFNEEYAKAFLARRENRAAG